MADAVLLEVDQAIYDKIIKAFESAQMEFVSKNGDGQDGPFLSSWLGSEELHRLYDTVGKRTTPPDYRFVEEPSFEELKDICVGDPVASATQARLKAGSEELSASIAAHVQAGIKELEDFKIEPIGMRIQGNITNRPYPHVLTGSLHKKVSIFFVFKVVIEISGYNKHEMPDPQFVKWSAAWPIPTALLDGEFPGTSIILEGSSNIPPISGRVGTDDDSDIYTVLTRLAAGEYRSDGSGVQTVDVGGRSIRARFNQDSLGHLSGLEFGPPQFGQSVADDQ